MGKGQINIDLLFAYLVFTIFVWYFSGFVLDLFTPFLDYSKSTVIEKNSLILRNNLIDVFSVDNAKSSCNISIPSLAGSSVSYTISAFNILSTDELVLFPNMTYGRIVLKRERGNLIVMAGTNETPLNASIRITFPESIVKTESFNITEGTESISYSMDEFSNFLFTVNLSVNSTDRYSAYKILTNLENDSYVIVESIINRSSGKNLYEYLYIGDVKAFDSCTSGNETDYKTSFTHYKNLGGGVDDYFSLIECDAWWYLE